MFHSVRLLALTTAVALIGAVPAARAMPPETLDSVVSVLPDWPGQPPQGTRGAPEGTGIAIAPGLIATAWHVIAPAEGVDVRLADGRVLPARVMAHDPATDIALLSVDIDLRPFEIAERPALAQPVCAVGNGFGLGLSVSCGVVSALDVSNAGFNEIEHFVQTDAATNPGFSGGALVDAEGQLVGMVSAIFASDADTNIGINFAVSSELVTRVTDALRAEGVTYPAPGWRLARADRATLAWVAAPVVTSVRDAGAASEGGVRPGDLILAIDGYRTHTPRDVAAALALVAQDAEAYTVRVEREGQELSLEVAFSIGAVQGAGAARDDHGDCPHPQPVCRMRQAVFPVSSFDPLGSATRIGADLLVTNRHVVGDARDALVYTPSGPREATVLASDYPGDLVLLRVPGLPEDGVIPAIEAPVSEDGEFFAVGADIGRQVVRVFDPGAWLDGPAPGAALGRLHVTSRMQPGVSGGALVDASGALAGIAVGGGEGRYEAIPISDVQRLIDGQQADDAPEVTETLGVAYAACANALDAGVPDAAAVAQLSNVCARAQNHGQLLEAGRVLAQARAFDGAAELHAAAVSQVPNSVNARLSLLVSLQLGARFEEMIPHARWVLERVPTDPAALRFAVQAGVWGGDPALAEEGYAALLAADPAQADAARRFIDNAPPAPTRR